MAQQIDGPGIDNPGGGGGGGTYAPPPTTGQGWSVTGTTTELISFALAPAVGVNNIVVKEYASGLLKSTAKFALGSWCPGYGYPSEVEFFSDRLWWAGTRTDPQMIWGTQIGDYSNFGKNTPLIDSDAVSFAINARQVNAIMDLVPLDKLVILAKGGEFLMTGGQDDVVTPSTIGVKPQSYRGSGGLQARVVGDTAVFVQEQGQRIYDIGYRFEADGYKPQDISVWAEHLVEGRTIRRMEWAPAPWCVLWFARDDGTEIGCTYMPEQEVLGWHRHDTGRNRDGTGVDTVEDIVALPGAAQTEKFVLVRRGVNGTQRRYIEQMAPVFVEDIRDWCYVDSCLAYDGRNAGATTLTLSGGTDWTEEELLTCTASAALFSGASDVGDGFLLVATVIETDPESGEQSEVDYTVEVGISEYVSATVVRVASIGTVPAALRGVAVTEWTFMRSRLSGFDHLEGRRVAILADGDVLSNGRDGQAYVIVGGVVTPDPPHPVGVAQVGLPYRAHIETLEVNAQGGESVRDAKKLLTSVGVQVKGTRGVRACGGTLDETRLFDLPQREFENYAEPTQPLTGYGAVPVEAEWGENVGKFHLVSDDPLPMEVLALIPNVALARAVR